MTRIGRRDLIKGAVGLAFSGIPQFATPALAQSKWPDKPVRFIVPLAPGGGLDFVARQCGDVLTRQLGQQFLIENRTGAGGTLGMDSAMKSPPDGYTILISNDNAASAPHILKLAFDYTKELVPIIDISHQPQVFGVHPSLGVGSVAEYVANAKKNPGVGFASSGVGSNQHVLGEWFAKEAGIKLDHIPYRGAGQAVNDLIAGHVKSAFLGPTALLSHHNAGTIKIIGQSGTRRAPTLKDVPTLEESGFKGVVLETWFAAFAPPGMPPELVREINAAIEKSLADAKLRENLEKNSLEPIGGPPEQLGQRARADSQKYERLVRELNIKVSQN